jgi:glycerol-3-phosphate dehydrogenase
MPTVDLLVIGGGIHGAAVARDAALRGLSVVLAEKDDLASGTSSRSSKLIHGGLRYLETGQFGLVKEALEERAILLDTAPHYVMPLPFLLPFYKGASRPGWVVRMGLSLYDTLATTSVVPRHRGLKPEEALELEPDLPREGLQGAALFFDAQMDDARLVVANAMAAAGAGATVRTRTAVTALSRIGEGARPVWRAQVGGDGETIEARAVVNGAGPWVDSVRALAGTAGAPALRLTRGTHVVVPAITRERALLLFARRDKRVIFVLPWGPWSLVGTTDTDDPEPPDMVSPRLEDVRYLWDEIAARWPEHPAARDAAGQTVRVFAGLRPLVRARSDRPWDNPREARLLAERGLFSLVGGKYTTARRLAERAVDRVVAHLGARAAPCSTRTARLPGPFDPPVLAARAASAARATERTGTTPDLSRSDVDVAIDCEFARGVSDVLFRRSALWLNGGAVRTAAPQVVEWMGERLSWSPSVRDAELSAVTDALDAEAALLRAAANREDAR